MSRLILKRVFWFVVFFSVASAFAIVFQKIFLPLAGYGGNTGLLEGDSKFYHISASIMANKIQTLGWSEFRINVADGATGNVALLAILYLYFGNDPAVIIPVNAGLHAMSAILLMEIAKFLWPGRVGRWVGYISAFFFLLSPSALVWYGQLNKDGFFIAGLYLLLFCLIIAGRIRNKRLLQFILTCAGIILIAFVRPYALWLIFLSLIITYTFSSIIGLQEKKMRNFVSRSLILSLILGCALLIPKASMDSTPYGVKGGVEAASIRGEINWNWEYTSWLPMSVDKATEVLAKTRVGLILESKKVSAGSNIYENELPNTVIDVLYFVPQALQVCFFAPFPNDWLDKPSLGKLVVVVEIFIWYILVWGVLFEIMYVKDKMVVELFLFCAVILVVYGIAIANLGTLQRIRFPYIHILMMIGLAGWIRYLQRKWDIKTKLNMLRISMDDPCNYINSPELEARKKIAKNGLLVVVCTIIVYLGFFFRDILIARMYGLSQDVDAFYIASVVPLFMVSALSVPLGTAVIPFINGQKMAARIDAGVLIQSILPIYFFCSIVFAIFYWILARYYLYSTEWGLNLTAEQLKMINHISLLMVAMFLLSGFLTISNAILTALDKPYLSSYAQIVVPAIVIVAIAFFGESYGIMVLPIAMLLGQLLNLLLLTRWINNVGVTIWPSRFKLIFLTEFWRQYLPLVVATVFMQVTAPVSIMMAASLKSGDVGALGLGGKLVIFLTGLITAGLSSVVLPYFSKMMLQSRVIDARRELSFLLLSGTVASLPITALIFLFSKYLVIYFFQGGVFNDSSTLLVTNIMELGVLQLPFFVVNVIMLKYAIAKKRSNWVLVASFIGLVANVSLNIGLGKLIGIVGISLSISISVAITAGLLLLVFFQQREIALLDLLFILINWLIFLSMAVCMYYHSWVSLFAAFLAFSLLTYSEWEIIRRGRHALVVG